MLRPLALTLRMIKFEHTLFALPFALLSLLVATGGRPEPRTLAWILVAMVGARSTAMAFNRLADHHIDAANPRTATRELPAGALSRGAVATFTAATAGLFVLAAGMLNPLCLALSPVALAIVYGYSFMKRVSPLSHLVLGLGLAVAPIGAWLAATGSFAAFPLWLGGAVLLWVAGFDTIYACQDLDFDRARGLHSLPARLGAPRALWLARAFHLGALLLWWRAGVAGGLGAWWLAGVGAVALMLAYEHWLVRGGDLRRIDRAFFELNSWVGMALFAFACAGLYLGG